MERIKIINKGENLNAWVYLILIVLLSSLAFAVPDEFTLQGKLTDLAGASQVGKFNFSFKIYDSYTGGVVLYDKVLNITTDANGIYDIILKNLSSLNFSEQYYLGITVRTDNESTPRINLTSVPYTFRANVSEDLNRENAFEVSVLNITGNLTLGESFADVLSVTTGRINISDGSITLGGNLTLGERIKFSLGSIIDNLISGFLRIDSGLNITGNVSIAQDTLFVDNTSSRVGIGTNSPTQLLDVDGNVDLGATSGTLFVDSSSARVGVGLTGPNDALEVVGNVRISGSLNATSINTTGDAYFATSSGSVGIGTTAPDRELKVIGKGNFTEGVIVGATSSDETGSIRFNTGVFQGFNGSDWIQLGNFSVTSTGGGWTDDGTIVRLSGSADLVGIGTTTPNDALEVIGNVRISGSLNATNINATGFMRTTNLFVTGFGTFGTPLGPGNVSNVVNVTSIPAAAGDLSGDFASGLTIDSGAVQDAEIDYGDVTLNDFTNDRADLFYIGNLTSYFGDTGFNGSVLRSTNITFVNATDSLPSAGDISGSFSAGHTIDSGAVQDAEIDYTAVTLNDFIADRSDLFVLGNLTSYFGDSGINGSVIRTGNLSLIFDERNGSLWDRSGTDTILKNINDNVGIGTSLPAEKLVVIGSVNISDSLNVTNTVQLTTLSFADGTTQTTAASGGGGAANSTAFNRSGTNVFLANIDDNVGIGTTTPNRELTVIGKGNFSEGIIVGDTANDQLGSIRFAGGVFQGFNGSDWFIFGNSSLGAVGWTRSGNVVRLLTSTDSVGIGTISPNDALEIVGNVRISGSLNATNINATGFIQTTDLIVTGFGTFGTPLGPGNVSNVVNVTSIPAAAGDLSGDFASGLTIDSSAVQDDEIDYSTVTLNDFINDRADLFYIGNLTDYFGDSGINGSVIRTGNLSLIFDERNGSLWDRSGTDTVLKNTGDNVGIGTTTPDNKLTIVGNEITANAILHLNASDNFNKSVVNVLTLDHVLKSPVNSTGGVGVSILFRATDNASQLSNLGNISAILYNATNGSQLSAITFSTRGADTGDDSFGHLQERLRIDGYGRIGINTTSPNQTLTVIGTLSVVSGSDVLGLYQDSSANVGIGTSTPNTKLEVNGTTTIGGDLNVPNNDVNIGGGYDAGGITLVSTGSGQFANDILLDGDIIHS